MTLSKSSLNFIIKDQTRPDQADTGYLSLTGW